jgi:acetolactate synthase-1/2/3 large subunit
MGIGLPGAIGAKLARPDKKVMAVCGDGAFIMSLAEFETAVRLKVPIVIMIWRDGRYGMIEWEQRNKLGHSSSIQFDNPDFVALAKTYGAKGFKVKQAVELSAILQKALSEDGPVIVECEVDYQENFRLSERLKNLH